MNFLAGQTIANEATITLGNAGFLNPGYINIYNYTGSTDVVVDVQGYYTSADDPEALVPSFYYPISYLSPVTGAIDNAPLRVLDTRPGSGQQGAGQTIGPDAQITFLPGTSTFALVTDAGPAERDRGGADMTEATEIAAAVPDGVGYRVWSAVGIGPQLASWHRPDRQPSDRALQPADPVGLDLQLDRVHRRGR